MGTQKTDYRTLRYFPPIQKCNLSDENCMKSAAQSFVPTIVEGIAELGTEVLDVMHVDLIKVNLAGLKLTMRDAEIKGLKKSVIEKISIDMAKKELQLVYHMDIALKSKYKAAGRLLILPISGDGDATIKLKNLQIQAIYPFVIAKNADGKDTIELKSYKYNYKVKDNAHFHLTNLFNGNKQLSDVMLNFMNQNWKTLTDEFGTPVLDQPQQRIFNAIRDYLKAQPLEEIAIV
ncbi:hypothetical protein O3G_MSEX005138 [Manduca sexta]|uniref:Uncharacterized protein n=1 Tax=Manduca sexta TaxID=7130 RepID=A0A921YYZ6_MANSE|nr:hypothetical protein O3G_MSEX005138 [Manduca sexta]